MIAKGFNLVYLSGCWQRRLKNDFFHVIKYSKIHKKNQMLTVLDNFDNSTIKHYT